MLLDDQGIAAMTTRRRAAFLNTSIIEAAHQTAARYPRDISEFDATGLTPEWHPDLNAPMVAEAAIKLGLRLREHQELSTNRSHLLIGEIVLADVPEAQITTTLSLHTIDL